MPVAETAQLRKKNTQITKHKRKEKRGNKKLHKNGISVIIIMMDLTHDICTWFVAEFINSCNCGFNLRLFTCRLDNVMASFSARVHKRTAVAQLVEALRYKPERRGFDS
jgi:hypothetical protein